MHEDAERSARLLADEHVRLSDFARTVTIMLGLLPLLYGVLTWVYGDKLWSGTNVYETALALPGAPQSWGAIFFLLGVGMLLAEAHRSLRCIAGFSLATALILATFMVTFIVELIAGHAPAAPPAMVYAILSLILLSRSRLAWLGRSRKEWRSG